MNKTELSNGVVYLGNSIDVVKTLPDNSVDCVITSPPYYQLRDYNYEGQWGLEDTYKEYLDNLISLMHELKRVLKDTGTMWINLGDTYMNNSSYSQAGRQGFGRDKIGMLNKKDDKIRKKSLMMMPERFAIRCIDEVGLILRNSIIWASPNKIPESVTDRFSKKKEYIYFFTKQPKYYFDLDSIKDPLIHKTASGIKFGGNKGDGNATGIYSGNNYDASKLTGKNPGDVTDLWKITNKPNSDKHYASYNAELINKPLIAGCPEGGVVLDPFAGTGTTGIACIDNKRKYIMIDMSEEYYNLMVEKLTKKENDVV